jgi:hypothetical protein
LEEEGLPCPPRGSAFMLKRRRLFLSGQPPKIMYDPDTGNSKGFGFVSYDSFEASDYAIECMNGAYLGGRPIVVQYAYKKVRSAHTAMVSGTPSTSVIFLVCFVRATSPC